METKRLKNIAILILLLLNVFLVILLVYQDLQTRRVDRAAVNELRSLFAAEELTLSNEVDPMLDAFAPIVPVRSTETEAEIAAFLLGQAVSAHSEGGGIFSYTSEFGSVQFRSGGGFDAARLAYPVEDPTEFTRLFCEKFGYGDLQGDLSDGGSYTAVKYIDAVPVYGCTVTFTFRDGCLVSVAGAYVDHRDAQEDKQDYLQCMSALIRFFDYRREEGVVCSVIESVQCVYQLQSNLGSPRLCPLWVVETDTYTYLVDGLTGEVSRG